MSLKRVVLLAAAVVILTPAAAMADTLGFGWGGGAFDFGNAGNFLTNDPTIAGTAPGTALSTFTFLARLNPLPVVSYGIFKNNVPSLGTTLLTTGSFTGIGLVGPNNAIQLTFASGGSVVITSDANFQALTGIAAGTVLFTGSFVGPTTLTQTNCFGCQVGNSTINFQLVSNITGNINPIVMAFFGINGPAVNGFILETNTQFFGSSQVVSIISGDAQVATPEPGTLALFGTGLLGLAGLVRRKMVA